MAALSSYTSLFLGISLLCLIPTACLAQRALRDVNDLPWPDDNQNLTPAQALEKSCPHGASFLEMAMSVEESCSKADSVEVILPLHPDSRGFAHEKRVRGAYEFHEYHLKEVDQDGAYGYLMGLIPMAGFIVKYAEKPSVITAQRADTWVLIKVEGESYNVSLVKAAEAPVTVVTTAEDIAREMQAHNRADIYGIEFFAPEQSIHEGKSPMLPEILKYLNQNPDLSVVIESHKFSKTGPPEVDSEITRERANAVMDWLVAHGIARARLQPRPYGRDNPLTENDSPSEVQRNERIAISKAKVPGKL